MKKRKKKQNNRVLKHYTKVLSIFEHHPRQTFTYKQIAHRVESNNLSIHDQVMKIIAILIKEDKVEEVGRGQFRYQPEFQVLTGIVDMTQRGSAYIKCEEIEDDIHVSAALVGNAFNGDRVTVELLNRKGGRKLEGRIVEVIERARTQFVGTVEKVKDFAFVIPDDSKVHVDFFVKGKSVKRLNDGDKVLVEMHHWDPDTKNPKAKVIKVLGRAGEHNTEMHAIVAEFGFRTEFDPVVLREAAELPGKISSDEIKKRKDCRKLTTFTIDPDTAKDFDDALSFRKISKDRFEVGVHIADVSHYVREGSALDQEAWERGTSVYLVDRTIPMLPERLSNELCSLRPNEDSLTFSAIFELDREGNVHKQWFGKSIIHSDRRFTYEEAQEIIVSGKGEYHEEIGILNSVAKNLTERRFKNGSIGFESDEFKFRLDENGAPLEVYKKERFDAHKLIEEYMLLANRKIAEYVATKHKGQPLPYRVHEAPNAEKLQVFAGMAAKFGFVINTSSHESLAKSINYLVEKTMDKPEAMILHPLAIRSMEKAFYTTKKTSHFGLGFEYYCHFTSPIRRYPDLIVHRLLEKYLEGEKYKNTEEIEKACMNSSKMELKAMGAERASVKYKQTEYISKFIGEEFEGIISGVTEWGIYVEIIENYCEGMVRIKDITGDFYEFYEKEMSIIGRRTKTKYTLGDKVTIEVKRTNLQKRTIDFILVRE